MFSFFSFFLSFFSQSVNAEVPAVAEVALHPTDREREARRIRKQDMVEDDEDDGEGGEKKPKASSDTVVPMLNYAGTNLPGKKPKTDKPDHDELNCAGLPPNAVDEEGNILVTDYDVLCGRGGLTHYHEGNKRFLDVVALHRPDYVRAPKIQKPSVAHVIVRAIRNGDPPGRFLRKDEKIGKWVDIGDKKAAEKTSQALRYKPIEEITKKTATTSASALPKPASYLAGTLVPAPAPSVTVVPSLAETPDLAIKEEEADALCGTRRELPFAGLARLANTCSSVGSSSNCGAPESDSSRSKQRPCLKPVSAVPRHRASGQLRGSPSYQHRHRRERSVHFNMTNISSQSIKAEVPAVAEVALHPTDRDVILGEGSAGHKANFLLEDLIRLHRILWTLHSKPPPTVATEIQPMVERIISIIRNGKSFEMAGFADIPKPLRSKGRFLGKDSAAGAWKVLSDDEVNTILSDVILDEFKVDDLGLLNESPYSDFKDWINKNLSVDPLVPVRHKIKDAIFLPVDQEVDKQKYQIQKGDETLVRLASQLVTADTDDTDKRVEAAFHIMCRFTANLEARFLVPTLRYNQFLEFYCMDPASVAEYTVISVFEVILQKEIPQLATSKPSLVPIQELTDHDVLCGCGLISLFSHPGNWSLRFFLILYRPDYIRADAKDKPAVLHKIVKNIRQGFPVGRFLKKGDDGMYYDVGDRTATKMVKDRLEWEINNSGKAVNEHVKRTFEEAVTGAVHEDTKKIRKI